LTAARVGGSLRWRLLRAASVASILVIVVTGLIGYFMASHEAEELMDGHLAQEARLLMALTRSRDLNLEDLRQQLQYIETDPRDSYEPKIEFQIGDATGTILLRSEGAPRIPVMGVVGYSEIEREGVAWRIFNLSAPELPYRVQVAQSLQIRERVAVEVATQVVWPLAIILPALILLLYYAVRRGLLPLEELAAEVGRFTPDSIQPLSGDRAPQEARPLVLAINRLLARLTVALEGERRFTADAAHELRTPLAALKVHSEVALASDEPEVRTHALRQVRRGVNRAGHLVEQLLRLARLDPLAGVPEPSRFDLVQCVREEVAQDASQGLSGDHTLVFEGPETVLPITGDPCAGGHRAAQPAGQRPTLFPRGHPGDRSGLCPGGVGRSGGAGPRARCHRRRVAPADRALLPWQQSRRRGQRPGPGHRATHRRVARGRALDRQSRRRWPAGPAGISSGLSRGQPCTATEPTTRSTSSP